jgi:hypothetical protein
MRRPVPPVQLPRMMLGYFAYAAGAFAVIAALSYYRGKLADGMNNRHERRTALNRIGQLRMAEDATFEPSLRIFFPCSASIGKQRHG